MEEFEKVEDSIFRFEVEGDAISGKLISIEDSMSYDNKVYKLQTDDGLMTVFGTTVLDRIMKSIEVGTDIKIVYKGLQESKEKGYQPYKLFEVFKKKV